MVAICVSVGSAVPAALEEIAALERALGAAAPDMEWKRAFTSRRARQMLARQRQPTLSLQEALAGAAGQPGSMPSASACSREETPASSRMLSMESGAWRSAALMK